MTTTVKTKQSYWRAVERTFGMGITRSEWNGFLQEQGPFLDRYIRPTGNLVTTYPCPNEFGCRTFHEIRVWRDIEYLAVPLYDDYNLCRTYSFTREEVAEYELDASALLSEAFGLLDLRPGALVATAFPETYQVGSFSLASGKRLQAYLVIARSFEHFREAVTGLLATVDAPFLFMSLTQHYVDPVGAEGLQRHGCAYVSMDEVVQCNELGDLERVQGLREVISLRLPSESGAQNPKEAENVFRLEGAAWTMGYAGETVHLPDTKGFRYIALLLAEPDKKWTVEALLAAVGNGGVSMQESASSIEGADLRVGTSWSGHAGPVIDEQAKRQYRARLHEIDEEMEEACFLHDEGRLAALTQEKESLQREILAAVGNLGKVRTGGNEAEKASDAVSKAIRRGTDLIAAEHPRLARHLRDAIKRGYTLSYEPESPTVWHIN